MKAPVDETLTLQRPLPNDALTIVVSGEKEGGLNLNCTPRVNSASHFFSRGNFLILFSGIGSALRDMKRLPIVLRLRRR